MKSIRIGKDIAMTWGITTNGEPLSLVGRDLALCLTTPKGGHIDTEFSIGGENNNELHFTYEGRKHQYCGNYSLTLWENYGKVGQTVVDKMNAFRLVANTDLERDE
jgi:hypothetical protein